MVTDASEHPAHKAGDKTQDATDAGKKAAEGFKDLLSQQATKPGDQGALAAVKGDTATTPGDAAALPKVKLDAPPALDPKTVETTAAQLHEALTRRAWHHMSGDPDTEKVKNLLGSLSAADRKAVEKSYHDQFDKDGAPDSLRRDLKSNLSESDYRRSEATLNSQDGRTNDAGALMAGLTDAKDDKEKGSAEVRAVLQNLNNEQLKQLDADFRAQYGKSYKVALTESQDLTKSTCDALPYLEKGVDKRSSEDLTKMAAIAIDNHDTRLFSESVRGDSPEAVATRKAIMGDPALQQKLADAFPNPANQDLPPDMVAAQPFDKKIDPVALDYLKDGRISLATIADGNTGKWLLNDKANIELAAKNATDKEKDDFNKGRELAAAGKAPGNDDEKRELDFYNKIHSTFKNDGNDRETAIWEDQLVHGRETIISSMAKTHSDGWAFGLGSGTDHNGLMTQVENLSKQDYDLLRGKDGDKFRDQIAKSLDIYAPEDKERVMKMLKDKADAPGYEESQKIHRSLEQTKKDSEGSVFLGMGTSYDSKNVIKKIVDMSPEDAANYKNDPAYRAKLDKFVADNFDQTQKALAAHVLQEVATTGKPAKGDAYTTLLNDQVQGAAPAQILADTEKALQDPATRAALAKADGPLTDEQKQIKLAAEQAVTSMLIAKGADAQYVTDADVAKYTKPLFESGRLSSDLKADLDVPRDQMIKSVADAPQAERDAALKKLSADDQAIVTGIRQNADGKPDLADRIRMMADGAGGAPEDFKGELTKLSFEDRQKLKDEYTKKYGKDIDQDFLDKVDKTERSAYADLLRPAATDGRQTYYDNYHKMLESESGFSADGSKLTLERASDMYQQSLEEYQKVYKTLPPEKQQALDQYFNQSLEQYKDSKEKLAEIVVDATIAAAALATAPLTGGASLAAVIGMSAAAGAAFRVAAMKTIEGNDFDGSAKNIVKQLVIGGTSAAVNFIGAEVLAGAGQLASGVAGEAVAGVALVGGREVLEAGGQQLLARELPGLIAKGGKTIAQEDMAALVAKAAPAASVAEREAICQNLQATIARTYDAQQAKICEEIAQRTTAQAARQLGKEALTNGAIASGANVASELVVAPFNDKGVDWDALKNGGLQGALIGAVLPVALKGLVHAAGAVGEVVTNVTKRADGLYLDPKTISEPITLRNSQTGEVKTVEPGKGDAFKLTNEWQPEVAAVTPPKTTSPAAAQSSEFAGKHEISEPLKDGFTYESANRQLDSSGKPIAGTDPAFVVDKKELAPIIDEAKNRFMSLPPEERAAALSKYVHEKFNPQGMSQQDINKWYMQFIDAHPGEKMSLGQFIKEGKGVCTQEAVLLKVLGDELGLKPTLVRGNGLDGGDDINHAWTTFDFGKGPLVYDPRQGISGVPADQVKTHKPAGDNTGTAGGDVTAPQAENSATNPLAKYNYEGSDGWMVDSRNADGSVNLRKSGSTSIKPGQGMDDFRALNAEQLSRDGSFKVGQQYKVRRPDGTIDTSYRVSGFEPDGSLRLTSERASYKENVKPGEMRAGGKPEMTQSAADMKKALAADSSFEDFWEHAVEATPLKDDPEVQRLVAERIARELKDNPQLSSDLAKLRNIGEIADEFGLHDQFQGEMRKVAIQNINNELKNSPKLFENPDKLKAIKDVVDEFGLHGQFKTQMAEHLRLELRENPDVLTDPSQLAIFREEFKNVVGKGGASKELAADLLTSVKNALKDVEEGKLSAAADKLVAEEHYSPYDAKVEAKNRELAALSDIAKQSGVVSVKNAVDFFELNGTAFEGTLDHVLTPRQLQAIHRIDELLLVDQNQKDASQMLGYLKEFGFEGERNANGHWRVVDIKTKEPFRDYTEGQLRNADGKPMEDVTYAIAHGSKAGTIGGKYVKTFLKSLREAYRVGDRP